MMLSIYLLFIVALVCLIVALSISKDSSFIDNSKKVLASAAVMFAILALIIFFATGIAIIYKMLLSLSFVLMAISVFRGVKGKYPHKYLSRKIATDTFAIAVITVAIFVLARINLSIDLFVLAIFMMLLAAVISAVFSYLSLTNKRPSGGLANLPTVSVLVPARNEDHVLQEALNNLLKLDYPKLEIIVLDDCSQDKTSEIVASYAHDGVRFIQGLQPESDWTGKTHALNRLIDEASGEYLVFCDVDIRFAVDSVTNLINYVTRHNLDMVSVMPARRHFDLLPNMFVSNYDIYTLLSTVLPSKLQMASRSCYVVRSELISTNGFELYKDSLIPETLFARTVNHSMVLGSNFDVTTRKRISSIYETNIRITYPIFRNSVAFVYLKTAISVALLYVFALTLIGNSAAIVLLLLFVVLHVVTSFACGYSWPILGVFGWPLSFISHIVLDLVSMIKYEFFEVRWKQRNVCYPVLKAIPRLPKLDD